MAYLDNVAIDLEPYGLLAEQNPFRPVSVFIPPLRNGLCAQGAGKRERDRKRCQPSPRHRQVSYVE
jgi:hypothetical protein